jgi:hypothetical protein
MEQRPLRLGDHVDDYCPRERRITNHVIVAIVEDAIRQTRCSTCDAEHVYKEAREPRRRKKDTATLFEQVMADVTGTQLVPPRRDDTSPAAAASANPAAGTGDDDTGRDDAGGDDRDADETPQPERAHDDLWPGHRTLIRATLPKIEGELPPPRPIPEFTMHQRPVSRRSFGFRPGGHANGPERNGNVAGGGEFRHGRSGQNNGQGPHRGNGSGSANGNGQGQGSGRRRRRNKHRPR